MRSLRILVVAATVLGGLSLGGRAEAALAYFTETAPASATYAGSGVQPLVGDFDGDGRSDVFLYRPGAGAERLKLGRADRTFATTAAGISVSGTYRPLVGDFDGNGVTDIFWYAPGAGADSLWRFSVGGGHTSTGQSVGGTFTPIVGDLASSDGAARDDIFWYAPGAAPDYLWRATGSGHFTSTARSVRGTYRPVVGAFTPDPGTGGSTDSTLDIFWYATGPTVDVLWKGNGAGGFTSASFNAPDKAIPSVGYFDGFGVQDILWNKPTGTDAVWLADPDTGTFATTNVQLPASARVVLGPFGIPDEAILLWSPTGPDDLWFPQGAPGTWSKYSLANNTDMGAGYLPTSGDFDGDGSVDLWWLDPSSGADPLWFGANPDS